MSNKIRCPSCRGSKKVAKLGGIVGDCGLCEATGQINAVEKVVPVVTQQLPMTSALIEATANAVQVTDRMPEVCHMAEISTLPVSEPVKVQGKRAIYKRKKA